MPDYIFVSDVNTKFDGILSMALAALMAQKEMRFYTSSCTEVVFHWSGNVINQSQDGQAVYVR